MSCSVQPALPARRTIVSVNGATIPHAAIARETQNHPAANPVEAWRSAARALAVRELLRQEAARLAVVAEPQADDEGRVETPEEAAMRALVEQEVRTPEPCEEECRRYYDNNLARFSSREINEVAHILIAAAPQDAEARAAARAQAVALCERACARPETFGALAREFSACPSAQQDGNLGQLSGGETVAEFEAALGLLQPGEITRAPVETRFGFHVVRLARRIAGRTVPFELAQARIRDYLAEAVRRRALAQYIAVLAGRAEIRGVEFDCPETLM